MKTFTTTIEAQEKIIGEIDRLRAELATHCGCRFESASQNGGCELVEQCKFHASEEENLVRPLRVEIERLESALEEQHAGTDAVWNEKAELRKENDRLRAEVKRLEAFENAGLNPDEPVYGQTYVDNLNAEVEHLLDGNGNLCLQVKELTAERDALRDAAQRVLRSPLRFIREFGSQVLAVNPERADALAEAARKAGEEPH